MKRKIKKGLIKTGKTIVLVLLLASLNINPLAMLATVVVDSGVIGKFSNLSQNLVLLAGSKMREVNAEEDNEPSGPIDVNVVGTPDSYFSTTETYMQILAEAIWGSGTESTSGGSLMDILTKLYQTGSQYSNATKIDADNPSVRSYGNALAVHDEASTARLLGVNERDLSHINAAQIEQLMEMGYDPRWVNENGTIEEDFDKLIRATHEYAVANVYSLNNMIGGALWRPYSDDIPYIQEFAEIVGGFANVYMGYWDTNVSTLKKPINSQRALEILGYDAILRYEGIQVLEPETTRDNGVEVVWLPDSNLNYTPGMSGWTESPVDRTIDTDPDTHYEDLPDRDLSPNTRGRIPSGQSGSHEAAILRPWDAETGMPIPETEITSAIIPDSQMVQLYQEEIPNQDITWLDAVTVLYKALDQGQITYQTFTAYNPNLTPETSPLSKDLPGLTSFDGYNFYAFFTRANPYSGDITSGEWEAIYWRKAINDGFVSYALRDQVISAEDFYMLATRMMQAFGEPEMSNDEMHTLLQIYGSYYPVQLGRAVADSWEYLKCRGILTEDNCPESFTDSLTRDQLLDICMRIKDEDSRITYKNMNLVIDVGDILRDNDYFPVYDYDIKTDEDDEYTFISTTVQYTAYESYTYMVPITQQVNLGYSGCGLIYDKPEKSNENLVVNAIYQGKKHIEGYDYYVFDVPKDYEGEFYLGFQNYDDPDSVNGTVDFIEFPTYCLGGGIFTSYEVDTSEKIAKVVKPVYGESYFDFNSQSNNMDLIYYCDKTRCAEEGVSKNTEEASADGVWGSIVDTWNYLTQPVEVFAAELVNDNDERQITKEQSDTYTMITRVSVKGDYWQNADEFYGEGNNRINLCSNERAKQLKPNAPGWLSVLTRASNLCATDGFAVASYGDVYNGKSDIITLTKTGTAVYNCNKAASAGKCTEDVSLGDLVATVISNKGANSYGGLYSRIAELQGQSNAYYRKLLIAFAAGIRYDTYTNIDGNKCGSSITEVDEDIEKAMKTYLSNKGRWYVDIGWFNSVGKKDSSGGYKEAVLTRYSVDEQIFKIYTKGHTDKEVLDKIGYASSCGNESGMVSAAQRENLSISTSLNTSAIMGKDGQMLLCWDDLVRCGFAWGIDDGKPKYADDMTYSFMTTNGMVKVNDKFHLIQIGTTLYSWPDDDNAPNLVYVDNNSGDMYFDIRCVTGIINREVTIMEGKTEIIRNSFGVADAAVYSISASSAKTNIYKTKEVSCYNFPDVPNPSHQGIASGSTFPVTARVISTTAFDGVETGTGETYWDSDSLKFRQILADFNPTSNWMVTVTTGDTAQEASAIGKLYVYYLSNVFGSDVTFSDGDRPPTPIDEWVTYWEDGISEQKKRCDVRYPNITATATKALATYKESLAENNIPDWVYSMTAYSVYSVAADTGTFYLSDDYAIRCFDITENTIATQPTNTDFRESIDAVDNDFRSNDDGAIYFIDYAGYVYNTPDKEDWNIKDYLAGKYPLPTVSVNNHELWNFNMTWYGTLNDGSTTIPYGYELTSNGYLSYKCDNTLDADLPQRKDSATNGNGDSYSVEDLSLPFSVTSSGSASTFKPAPTAIHAYYGVMDDSLNDVKISMISQNETLRNYYYLGNRVVCISNDFTSRDANMIPWDFGAKLYNPISLSSSATTAHLIGQVRRPFARNYYLIKYSRIYEVDSAIRDSSDVEHLATDDSYLWEGKAKLVAVLNMIDRGTNWAMWAVFSLAPMICIIVMTILIGLSFITDSKIWLAFCEKFFDPVRILTLGMKDSNHWNWRDVWKRATITYIAFSLFANANILKIVIWVVDGWMRITEALGF